MMDVLVIEDDPSLADAIVTALAESGWTLRHVSSGREGLAAPSADIVLLDLGLPDMDGYDVCRELRQRSGVPIIVITARSEELDRVLGLELGADDYVVKPFGMRELQARMRAVLRRTGGADRVGGEHDEPIEIGGLRIDRRSHEVTLNSGGVEQSIALTPKEFALLVVLAEDPGAVRTRADIIERVWDSNWFGPTKTVDAHVAGIRRKLGAPGWIESVRGVGFRLGKP